MFSYTPQSKLVDIVVIACEITKSSFLLDSISLSMSKILTSNLTFSSEKVFNSLSFSVFNLFLFCIALTLPNATSDVFLSTITGLLIYALPQSPVNCVIVSFTASIKFL